jgi:hypothetical protein
MKAMKLRDVEDITHIREMTYAEARRLACDNFATGNQAVALSLHTSSNTRDDWLRLQACLVILRHRRQRSMRR